MKVDFIKILFSWAFSAIFGYICYIIDKSSIYNLVVPCVAIGILTTAASVQWSKQNISIKTTLWIGIVIQVVTSLCFAIWGHNIETQIVTSSLLTISVLGVLYALYKAK